MSSLLRTTDLPARERGEFWRSAISESFVPLDLTLEHDEAFRGQIRSRPLGAMLVSDVTADAHRAERTRRLITRSETDFYKLSMPLRGYCLVMQDGREAPLTPGDLAVYDTSRPYTIAFDDTCQMLVLMFPQRFLRLRPEEMHRVTASRASGRQGMGALVSPLLATHWGFVDAAHFSRLFKATYGLSPREYRLTRDAHGSVRMSAS